MEMMMIVVEGQKRMEMISLTHQGQELRWVPLERTNISEDVNIFAQINAFWAQKPQAWQNEVFKTYLEIYRILNEDSLEIMELQRVLTGRCTQLLDMHDTGEIRHWVDFKSNLGTPPTVQAQYQEQNNSRWTRDKTYTLEDYRELVTMSIALRSMIPVWGEFISITKREYKAIWKEYQAYQLITQSKLMDYKGMQFFRNYVTTHLPSDDELQGAILKGISTVDYPDWITSQVLIRRVAIADIRGLPDKPSAISFVFLYLTKRTSPWNNSLMDNVQKKRDPDKQSTEAESKLSHFEEYKVKQPNSAGDIALIEQDLNQPHYVAEKLCPDLDMNLLEQSLTSVFANRRSVIFEPQLALIQYVLNPWINARAFKQFTRQPTLNAMAIAQAIYWHKGFNHLAALVSADEQRDEMEYLPGLARAPLKLSKELVEELDKAFPYFRHLGTKNKSHKERNYAINTIDEVSELFFKRDWTLTLPSEWLPTVSNNLHDRKYIVPVDLKIMLANLFIKLAARTF